MSQIRGKNTKPELLVRKFLFSVGYRYSLHSKLLPGKPDIVLPKYKTAIFINGCFWHGHEGCKYYVIPKTNTDWWLRKINRNIALDDSALRELKKQGWKTIVVFECNLKGNKKEKSLSKILIELGYTRN